MPRTTKTQTQADLLYNAETFLPASMLLEDDTEDTELLGLDSDDEAKPLGDNVTEILDLSALNWVLIAQAMSGDRSCGPYDQIPKSVDFFSVCLSTPDHEFCHMFR